MPGVTTAYQTGNHAGRPANGAGCILYSCTTHGLVYRDDGSSWTTYLTLPSAGYAPGGTDVAVADGGTGASTASAARTNLGLVIGTDVDAFASTVSQAEAEAGSATTVRNWTAQRVAQAIAALGGVGGGGDYEQLDDTLLGSAQANITFTGISGSHRDLLVVWHCRQTGTGDVDFLNMRLGNGSIDTGSNYGYARTYNGSASGTDDSTSASTARIGTVTGSTAPAGRFVSGVLEIIDYANSATPRLWLGRAIQFGTGYYMSSFSGIWTNAAAAIDQLRIYPETGNLDTGSRVTLYGRG